VPAPGSYARTPVETLSASTWRALDAVNLHAPLLLVASCLPQLRAAQGQVVFINSSAGQRAPAGLAAYAGGKHALRAAADALRQEVTADGVRVLSIFPGRTATPMQAALLAAEGRSAEPGQLMQPEDVAQMMLAALQLPRTAEVTEIVMRPMRPL
jgi:NADP-dependent 3-hydroxy acid dehydrogenase YdfG